jgi:hypothetical protein
MMDEKNGKTMFGRLLTNVQRERRNSRLEVVKDLWKRNGLAPNANGYRLAETTAVHEDGREVVEYRLYKLIDATVTTLTAQVDMKTETGRAQVADGKGL